MRYRKGKYIVFACVVPTVKHRGGDVMVVSLVGQLSLFSFKQITQTQLQAVLFDQEAAGQQSVA